MSDGREQRRKEFRFSACQVGLTYSQCGDAIPTRSALLHELRRIDDCVSQYAIAREAHRDGGIHYHVYLRFGFKRNIKDVRHWDCFGVHPNIRPISSTVGWLQYLRKEDRDTLESEGLPGGRTSYLSLALQGETKRAEDAFSRAHPREYLLNLGKVRANIRQLANPGIDETKFEPDSFPTLLQVQSDWKEDTTLVLSGPSDYGKTHFALALLKRTSPDLDVLFVGNKEALCGFDPTAHTILFDDFAFCDWKREDIIHALDCEHEAQIRILYGYARIPAGTRRVITTNLCFAELFPFPGTDPIRRRVTWVDVTEKLYVPAPVQVPCTPLQDLIDLTLDDLDVDLTVE